MRYSNLQHLQAKFALEFILKACEVYTMPSPHRRSFQTNDKTQLEIAREVQLRVPAENCEQPQDHALVVVGYGEEENGDKYWLIKNSWNNHWGIEGYMKLDRGMPGNGSLGLAANPGYPIKITANPHHIHPSVEQAPLVQQISSWGRKFVGFAS